MTPHTLHLLIFMIAASLTLLIARIVGAYINRRYLVGRRVTHHADIAVRTIADKNFKRK